MQFRPQNQQHTTTSPEIMLHKVKRTRLHSLPSLDKLFEDRPELVPTRHVWPRTAQLDSGSSTAPSHYEAAHYARYMTVQTSAARDMTRGPSRIFNMHHDSAVDMRMDEIDEEGEGSHRTSQSYTDGGLDSSWELVESSSNELSDDDILIENLDLTTEFRNSSPESDVGPSPAGSATRDRTLSDNVLVETLPRGVSQESAVDKARAKKERHNEGQKVQRHEKGRWFEANEVQLRRIFVFLPLADGVAEGDGEGLRYRVALVGPQNQLPGKGQEVNRRDYTEASALRIGVPIYSKIADLLEYEDSTGAIADWRTELRKVIFEKPPRSYDAWPRLPERCAEPGSNEKPTKRSKLEGTRKRSPKSGSSISAKRHRAKA